MGAVVFVYDYEDNIVRQNQYVAGHKVRIASTSSLPTDEIVYLTSVDKSSGNKTKTTIPEDGTTLDSTHIYSVEITNESGAGRIPPDTMVYEVDCNPHTHVYGICDCKCAVEVVSQEHFDELSEAVDATNEHVSDVDSSIEALNRSVNTVGSGLAAFSNRLITVENKTADSGWITLKNAGASSYTGNKGIVTLSKPLMYRKKAGIAYVRCQFSNYATLRSDGAINCYLAQLPEGYRPLIITKQCFGMLNMGEETGMLKVAQVVIKTDGKINIIVKSNCTGQYDTSTADGDGDDGFIVAFPVD